MERKPPTFEVPDLPFTRCACGTLTTRVPCWECIRRADDRVGRAQADRRKGIPARFGWARLDAPDLGSRVYVEGPDGRADVGDVARAVLAHRGPAVLFAGPAGSGKTSLAVACLRASPWPGALFVGAKDLERARIEQQAGRGEAPLVQRSLAARLLLVDDLGQDKPSAVSAVEAVLLARHDASRTTWVTTGLTARELEERYGAGIARRLTEKKTALVIRTSKEFKLT